MGIGLRQKGFFKNHFYWKGQRKLILPDDSELESTALHIHQDTSAVKYTDAPFLQPLGGSRLCCDTSSHFMTPCSPVSFTPRSPRKDFTLGLCQQDPYQPSTCGMTNESVLLYFKPLKLSKLMSKLQHSCFSETCGSKQSRGCPFIPADFSVYS